MLTENDIVDAVANHLRREGWHIDSTSNTNERGHDILATKDRTKLAIEAKGETSSKNTNRAGKPFSSSQVLSHISRALYKAAHVASEGICQAGIALPVTDVHQRYVQQIKLALKKLDIVVFFVNDDCTVLEWENREKMKG